MTTLLSRATVVAAFLAVCLLNTAVRAQGTAARPSGTSVAVIDLGDVFEKHTKLKAQLDQIKSQIDGFENYVREEKQKIDALAGELKTLNAGTPDYSAKEKEFATIQADLQIQVRQKSREFLEKEAKIRYDAYQEIQQHVANFCQSYGIQLVIRFNREPIDPTKPQEVQMGLNRPIVYQNSLDITQHIIDSVNPPAAAAGNPQAPAAVGRAPAIPGRTNR